MTDSKRIQLNPSKVSQFFWLAFVPLVGGLVIVRESNELRDRTFAKLGWCVFALCSVTLLGEFSRGYAVLGWLAQSAVALGLRSQHRAPPPPAPPPPPSPVEINSCSKDDLVRRLDIPIVYANDIEMARSEGFIFTHIEELATIAGIPETLLKRLEGRLIFRYDEAKDGVSSWRRINTLSRQGMLASGFTPDLADKIITERENNGDYRSAIDIKRRTGIAFQRYQSLL